MRLWTRQTEGGMCVVCEILGSVLCKFYGKDGDGGQTNALGYLL